VKVYVIFDQIRDTVREVHSNKDKAHDRCGVLDNLWKNPYDWPHVSVELELDVEQIQED